MCADTLTERKAEESASQLFTKMPSPHYIEVAMLILNKYANYPYIHEVCLFFNCILYQINQTFLSLSHTRTHSASEDVPRADEVRALVKDIWDLRLAKLRKSIDIMITQQETYGKVRPPWTTSGGYSCFIAQCGISSTRLRFATTMTQQS